MKIVQTPHPVLIQRCKPIRQIDNRISKIIAEMKTALKRTYPVGVGLAAPQIGYNLQIFIALNPPFRQTGDKQKKTKITYTVFINPKISRRSQETGKELEGCLSIPNVWGKVRRAKQVTLEYLDEEGRKQKKTFRGMSAIIIQHETDHLEGRLFTHHVIKNSGKFYRLVGDEKSGEQTLEEIKI